MIASRIYNSIPQKNTSGITTRKDLLDSENLKERINPDILDTFNNNPYTKPLNSSVGI